MRALISLVASAMMISLSAHAGSSTRSSPVSDDGEIMEHDSEVDSYTPSFEKQSMEETSDSAGEKKNDRGFEDNPRPYSPSSEPQERIQTED